MKWDDNILEKDHVLFSEGYCETRDDTCKNIEELSSTIEFMCFVDKTEEAFIDCFSNHFSAGYQLYKDFILISEHCIHDNHTRCEITRLVLNLVDSLP